MRAEPAPLLVLGLGNRLLGDDGVGVRLLELLERELAPDPCAEFVDGGTQGLALLGWLEGRSALLVLDAVALGAPPGHVHVLEDPLARVGTRGHGAHEGNASELFGAALLVGALPPRVVVVGIEPERLATSTKLSPNVERALPDALDAVRAIAARLRSGPRPAPTH